MVPPCTLPGFSPPRHLQLRDPWQRAAGVLRGAQPPAPPAVRAALPQRRPAAPVQRHRRGAVRPRAGAAGLALAMLSKGHTPPCKPQHAYITSTKCIPPPCPQVLPRGTHLCRAARPLCHRPGCAGAAPHAGRGGAHGLQPRLWAVRRHYQVAERSPPATGAGCLHAAAARGPVRCGT